MSTAYRDLGLAGLKLGGDVKAAKIGNKLGLVGAGYKAQKSRIVEIVRELDNTSKFKEGTAKIGAKHAVKAASYDVNTYATAIAEGEHGEKHGNNGECRGRVLDPALAYILARVRKDEGWHVDNCGEVAVVNKWLIARGPGVLSKIKVSAFYRGGKPKPPCRNCSQWLSKVGSDYRVRMNLAPAPAPAPAVPVLAVAHVAPPPAVPAAILPVPRGIDPASFAEFRRLVYGEE